MVCVVGGRARWSRYLIVTIAWLAKDPLGGFLFSVFGAALALGSRCTSIFRGAYSARCAVKAGSALVLCDEQPLTIQTLVNKVAEITDVEVVIDYEAVLPESVDGSTCLVAGRALISVSENSLQPEFTLLHELAHLALGHCSMIRHSCSDDVERQANALASRWAALIQTGELRKDIAMVFS